MNEATLRAILQAVETRAAARQKADDDYCTTLRQLLDQGMARKDGAE